MSEEQNNKNPQATKNPDSPKPVAASGSTGSADTADRSSRRASNRRRTFNNKREKTPGKGGPRKGGFNKRKTEEDDGLQSKVILVRRVTRVVKGGKRMRFSALVAVGDGNGKVGFALKKGVDYQDSVAKATKKAKKNTFQINLNDNSSLDFPSETKFKSCEIVLKPARSGTGLIAGGYVRPILELAGVKNVYSKILRSRNKVAGTEAVFEALNKYKK